MNCHGTEAGELPSEKRDSERGSVDANILKMNPGDRGAGGLLNLCQYMCVYMIYVPVQVGICERGHIHAMVHVEVRLWVSVSAF